MILTRLLTIPAQSGGGLWLPEQASTVARGVDQAWWLVYWVSVAFFVPIVIAQLYFMWTYRRRAGWTEQRTAQHNYALELTWSIVPSLLIVVMFVKGFLAFIDMRTPPANTYDITVVAKKWSWSFIYPNGVVSNELHAPVNRDVKLVMSSDDVIHSLFIAAFRIKQDIVPGRYNYLWFNAITPGEFDLQCAEFCGTNHSEMLARVVIHEPGGMEDWLEEQIKIILNMPPLELGALLYEQRGCSQCHIADGRGGKVGPPFSETFGNAHQFADGTSISAADANENFIRESIMNPQAQVRTGFPPSMPTYKGLLREEEIRGLIAFIKAQNPEFRAEAEREYSKPPTPADESGEGEADAAGESPDAAGGDAAGQNGQAPATD